MLKLQFRDQPGSFVKLSVSAVTLGRDESNDVVIDAPSVSDFHAEIINDSHSPVIVDLLSANGTFVNEQRISGRCQLNAWDIIRLGTVELEVTDPNSHRPEDCALRPESDLLGAVFHALGASTVIGRDEACDITIDSKLLSRRHARLIIEDDRLKVIDLGSANGTYLNGERVDEAIASPGDELCFDQERFTIVGPNTAQGPDTEPPCEQTVVRGHADTDDATVIAQVNPAPAEDLAIPPPPSGEDTVLIADEEDTLQFFAPPPAATLTEIGAAGTPRLIDLEREIHSAGRSETCDLFLDDKSVSKHHADFFSSGDQWLVRDMQSSNGVLVNQERVDQIELEHGDRIRLGRLEFEFKLLNPQHALDDSATRVFAPPRQATATAPAAAEKYQSATSSGPAKKSRRGYWVAGLAILLLGAGVAAVGFLYFPGAFQGLK